MEILPDPVACQITTRSSSFLHILVTCTFHDRFRIPNRSVRGQSKQNAHDCYVFLSGHRACGNLFLSGATIDEELGRVAVNYYDPRVAKTFKDPSCVDRLLSLSPSGGYTAGD